MFQVLSKGPFVLKYSVRFPRKGTKKGNPTMTASTVTAGRKGDPQHVLREKIEEQFVRTIFPVCILLIFCLRKTEYSFNGSRIVQAPRTSKVTFPHLVRVHTASMIPASSRPPALQS